MKYEVGKPYQHNASWESPLPEGSRVSYLGRDGFWYPKAEVNEVAWENVFAFVPIHIQTGPIVLWVNQYKGGGTGDVFVTEEEARIVGKNTTGYVRTIRMVEDVN